MANSGLFPHAFSLFLLVFVMGRSSGQMTPSKSFREKIDQTFEARNISPDRKIDKLLDLHDQLQSTDFDADSLCAYLLQKIGVLYFYKAQYDSAIYYSEGSKRIAEKKLKSDSAYAQLLMHDYYNLFYYYSLTEANEKQEQALDAWMLLYLEGDFDYEKALAVLVYKVDDYFNKGEYHLSTQYSKLGELLVEVHEPGGGKADYLLYFMNKQANSLYFEREFEECEKLLLNAVARFDKGAQRHRLGPFYTLLGSIYVYENQSRKAMQFFRKGLYHNTHARYNEGIAQSLVFIGSLLAKQFDESKKGMEYCFRSLKYGADADSLFAFKEIGDIFALQQMFDSAQWYYQKAFNTIRAGLNETNFLKNSFRFPQFNELQNVSEITTAKGNAYLRQFEVTKQAHFLKKAISVYKKNDLFLRKIKDDQHLDFYSNLVWRNVARSLYDKAIEACYQLGDVNNAFYFFERSRAILLNEQIGEQQQLTNREIRFERNLKLEASALRKKVSAERRGSLQAIRHQKQLCLKLLELKEFRKRVEKQSVDVSVPFKVVSLAQVKNRVLDKSQWLIEIFTGDHWVYFLKISPSRVFFERVDKKSYEERVGSFISYLSDPEKINGDFPGYKNIAHSLYQFIFPETLPGTRMIISPDQGYFPFEALLIEKGNEPYYLLRHYATSYTYSASYLVNDFPPKGSDVNILSLAPVHYGAGSNLSSLPGSAESVSKISKLFDKSEALLEKQATGRNFLNQFPAYQIVQLYTHARQASGKTEPQIFFADSALDLSGLLPEEAPATRLVVLMACETGLGKVYAGEGVFNLNRGFAMLGIPAAISTLWTVDNESTYDLTESFYTYLSRGYETDVALQKAKLAFVDQSSSLEKKLPYYWAGPVLIGKTEVLMTTSFPGTTGVALIFLFILLLALSYFLLHLRRRGSN